MKGRITRDASIRYQYAPDPELELIFDAVVSASAAHRANRMRRRKERLRRRSRRRSKGLAPRP